MYQTNVCAGLWEVVHVESVGVLITNVYICTKLNGPLPLECIGVGGALPPAPEPCGRTPAGEPRAWRSRGSARQRRGGFGTQGVAGVLRDELPAMRLPARAGERTTHPCQHRTWVYFLKTNIIT